MPAQYSNRRNAAAFTLIEVMVSIGVFMLVMGSVLACWRCVVNGKIIAEQAAAAAQRARVGMRTVEEALTCADIDTANIQYYAFLTDTTGKFASLSLAARLPGDFPGSGLFGDNVVRRVTFDVENENGVNNLVINQSPLLEALDEQNTPYPLTLARDVNVFMLEFWDPKEGDWAVSLDDTNKFPAMIRITLGVGHSKDNPDLPYDLIIRTVSFLQDAH